MFTYLDKEKKGYITTEDIDKGLNMCRGDTMTKINLMKAVQAMDVDGNGKINYYEFLDLAARLSTKSIYERLESAFKVLDNDGDGSITKEELFKFFNCTEDDS